MCLLQNEEQTVKFTVCICLIFILPQRGTNRAFRLPCRASVQDGTG
ncbi:hypothetical protein HMPREF0083_02575 [Aneurinibacillus aneurinilyticus ATCC 12856]|uniref:Uncharacterized protein n=1 Tax=Aneurinibacillus aneurinilyticus ATCC 12856 TaxID=649747 RepID=U1YEV8_ANEAE|nr:hypothetical protein HMPREF0083_02575 [Aneurinibacillus aneurinilyticus ATCC 12856]